MTLLIVGEGVAHYPTKNWARDQQCHFDQIESLFYLNLCANYILKLEYSFNYIYLSIPPIIRPITSYNCWADRVRRLPSAVFVADYRTLRLRRRRRFPYGKRVIHAMEGIYMTSIPY